MNEKFHGFPATGERIVYVRPVAVASLPQELQAQAQAGGLSTVYAVHDADGAPLALVSDRRLAFALARQHDMAPVSVN